jgi:hypothetical protein
MAEDVATNKLIGKQVIAAETLNAPLSNAQNKSFFFLPRFVATHASVIRNHAKKCSIMSVWHAQFLFDYDHSCFSVLWTLLVGEIQLSQIPEGKSGGRVKSGVRESHELDPPPRPNHRSANCQFKKAVTSFWISGGAS